MLVNCSIILLVFCTYTLALFDPLSIGIGAAIIGAVYKRHEVKEYTYCKWYECCNNYYVKNDLEGK